MGWIIVIIAIGLLWYRFDPKFDKVKLFDDYYEEYNNWIIIWYNSYIIEDNNKIKIRKWLPLFTVNK